ncbi:MAG: hypothetical protein KDE27_10125 [Planctomycetes bacterium]|nr:hypothetical protein [Planctomycetota bacterium]
MHKLTCAALSIVLAAHTAAQTFIVDANNGPGTDFTQIGAAVTAVPDGAVLEIRAGTYAPFQIDGKSMSLLAAPGAVVETSFFQSTAVDIVNIASHQWVHVRALGGTSAFGFARIGVRDSAGPVVLDALTIVPSGTSFGGALLAVTNCDHVLLHGSQLGARSLVDSPVAIFGSNVVIDDCHLLTTGPGIRQGGGRVQVNHSTIESNTATASLGSALLFLAGGEMVLHGDTTLIGGTTNPAPAAVGTGTIVLDPSIVVQNASTPAFDPNLQVVQRSIPRLDAETQALGGSASATLAVPSGATGFLYLGLPVSPYQVAGVSDPIWVAHGGLQAVGGSPEVTGSYTVPNAPWVLGVSLRWQGFVLDSGHVLASNPSGYVHH